MPDNLRREQYAWYMARCPVCGDNVLTEGIVPVWELCPVWSYWSLMFKDAT